MANMGPAGGRPQPIKEDSASIMGPGSFDPKMNLSTFIYDYFLKTGKFDLATTLLQSDPTVRTRPRTKKSPSGREVNGIDDPMDSDNKDDPNSKKLDGLPEADIQEQLPKASFLEDWWCVFWDIWSAGKGRRSSGQAAHYLNQSNRNQIMQRQMMQQQPQMMNMRGGAMNRAMPGNIRMEAMNNMTNRTLAQQMRNMGNLTAQQQAALQAQGGDMAGGQRPQSPMSSDNAPSPKRARIEGPPFTPNMAAGGQNRPVGMGMPNGPGQNPNMMPNGVDAVGAGSFNNMPGNPQSRMGQFPNMNGKFAGKQDFPAPPDMMLDEMGAFAAEGMPRSMGNGSQQGGALADYQMQLMLLEQQNKKRLLMARQEQEVTQGSGPPGATQAMMGGGGPGPGGPFQPGLSPRRNGQSPSPNDPSKRGNNMGQASPRPDGQMPMTRGSPAPGNFDPSQMPPGMGNQFFNPAQMGPNGMRPGAPGFPGPGGPISQMDAIRARTAGMPAGWGPQGPQLQPGSMPQQNQSSQQNPMPPPQAPNAGPSAGRTNPSSPAPSGANPPTPQQNKTANAKGGKKDAAKDTKKKPNKKGANNAGANASSEAEGGPPTPTPATPITPVAHNNPFSTKGANGQSNGQPPQPQQPNLGGQPDSNGMHSNNPFGNLDPPSEVDFSGLDFVGNPDPSDVLEGFDFDSFLNTDNGPDTFGFDAGFGMNGDGVEMGTRDI